MNRLPVGLPGVVHQQKNVIDPVIITIVEPAWQRPFIIGDHVRRFAVE